VIEGTISSINNNLIELLNDQFVIDASRYAQELGSSITVGMFIKVEADPPKDQNGPFIAKLILNTPRGEGIFSGVVQNVDPKAGSITLLNYRTLVDNNTNFSKDTSSGKTVKLEGGIASVKVGDAI